MHRTKRFNLWLRFVCIVSYWVVSRPKRQSDLEIIVSKISDTLSASSRGCKCGVRSVNPSFCGLVLSPCEPVDSASRHPGSATNRSSFCFNSDPFHKNLTRKKLGGV